MDLKILFKAIAEKAKQSKNSKKLAKSYVSLFLVLIIGISSTFAWFTQRKAASIQANNMEFQSASSLRINKDKSASNIIRIDKAVLDEASSMDGRNIYFPLDKSFSINTADMRFREGNKGDENVRYVYKDFDLKGTSGNTPVYIKSYEIKVEEADDPHDPEVNATYHDQLKIGYDSQGRPNSQTLTPDHCPIRLAFISDSGDKPKVIDPSAQVVDYVDNSDAVALIDENGVPTTKNTYNYGSSNSFASYYYGNTPLFVIPGGDSLNVTLVVWLEGTIADCDKYIGKKISVDIDIESNFAEMETITFYDDSQPDNDGGQAHWVSNDDPIVACSYEDPYSDETPKRWKTVIMSKVYQNSITDPSALGYVETYTWRCKIPKKVITNISFYRLSRANGATQGTIYNAWHTTNSISTWITASSIPNNWYRTGEQDLQTNRQYTQDGNTYNALVYTVVHGNGYSVTDDTAKRLAPCVGYWNYTGGSGGGSSGGGSSGGGESGGGSAASYSIQVNVETTNKEWIYRDVTQYGSHLWFWTQDGGNYELSTNGSNKFTWSGTLAANDEIVGFYITNSSGNGYKDFSVSATHVVTANWNVNYYVDNDDKMILNS